MEKQMLIARYLAGQIGIEEMAAFCRTDAELMVMLLTTVRARLERSGEGAA